MSMDAGSLAVVIPAYNEAQTIRRVAEGALAHIARVIVVDDGSSDATAAALEGLPVILVRNPANLGKAASLWRGMAGAPARGGQAGGALGGGGPDPPGGSPRPPGGHGQHPRAPRGGARG